MQHREAIQSALIYFGFICLPGGRAEAAGSGE